MLSVADQRRRRRCRNRRRCNIRHCSCESSNRPRVRPARQNIIGEFDERSLVNYYTGRPRVHARARARAHMVRIEKNANYEFLRCNSNVASSNGVSRSFFSSFSFSSHFLFFFISLGQKTRCRMKKVGASSRPTASEFRDYVAGIHKIFRSTFNDDVAVFSCA